MLSLICVVSLFLGQALASQSANLYMDSVINTALQNVIRNEKLDPTHLPDFNFEYKDKGPLGIKVKGKVQYTEGSLSKLSKVQRYGECGGNNSINCTLIFPNLETSHKGKVKYGVLPKVTIHGTANVQSVVINVGIVKSAGSPKVTSFSFSSTGAISTKFSGLGPLNNHMKVLEENYRSVVGAQVMDVIKNRFLYALNLAVANVPMPL